jgi:hypothetical protein
MRWFYKINFAIQNMLKSISKIGVLSLLAAALAGLPLPISAQTTNPPSATKQTKQPAAQKKPASASIPFQDTIAAVDKVARTITVGKTSKRVFQVTSETKIFKADKTPALFEDAVVDEHITGSYTKSDDGKLTAKSLYFGTKPDTKSDTKSDTKAPAPKSSSKK